MAQIKKSQLDEQTKVLKAREEREKEVHELIVKKLQQEVDTLKAKELYLQEKQKRQAEAHDIDMRTKKAQCKLLEKQQQEE